MQKPINEIHCINRIKKRNYMMISIDIEKTSDKISFPFNLKNAENRNKRYKAWEENNETVIIHVCYDYISISKSIKIISINK